MGWSKYGEDNRIRAEELYYFTHEIHYKRKDIIHYYCPYCNSVFPSKEDLYSHIKNHHNIVTPVLSVNGKIIEVKDNRVYYIDKLNSIELYNYENEINIVINDKEIIERSNEISLLDDCKKAFEQNGKVYLKINNINITIEKFSFNAIDYNKILPIILQWQKELYENKKLMAFNETEMNYTEKIYLEGVFNYFVACEAEGEDKKNRYFDAYARLSSFNPINSLGLFILKIITYRLNWIEKFIYYCTINETKDIFTNIAKIYMNENDFDKKIPDNKYIYIEPKIEKCIKAMNALKSKNDNDLMDFINENADYYLESDLNHKDRVLLILKLMAKSNDKINKYNEEILNESLKKIK